MTENYRGTQGPERLNLKPYNIKICHPLKTSQLKPVQMQQCLFDGDYGTFKLVPSVSLFLLWKHSN